MTIAPSKSKAISTVITIRVSPGGGDREGGLTPGLDAGVEAHGDAVEEVGQEEAGRLVPHDHRVCDGQDEDDDAHQVAETVPEVINIKEISIISPTNIEIFIVGDKEQ